ncbi:MAG TPA: DUF4136 domain-containing protein [Polyangiaceae bacterium]|nr:DUF4136 domain-containing protein [Polyangiaceae bacterium]
MKRAPLVGQGIVVFAALLAGCASPPPESDRLAESIVLTRHADDADFSGFRTYYLWPDVMTISDDGEPTPIDEKYATPLLNTVKKNMADRGFVAVDRQDAELGIELGYVEHVSTAYWCYYWYNPYYWGYPAWGYYPYYPCDATVWKSGMLATTMTDLTPALENPSGAGLGDGAGGEGGGSGGPGILRGIWFAGVYAVSPTTSGGVEGINQAFEQSPYIKAAK